MIIQLKVNFYFIIFTKSACNICKHFLIKIFNLVTMNVCRYVRRKKKQIDWQIDFANQIKLKLHTNYPTNLSVFFIRIITFVRDFVSILFIRNVSTIEHGKTTIPKTERQKYSQKLCNLIPVPRYL